MGARKKIAADKRKEARKSLYFASARDIPSSPRKCALLPIWFAEWKWAVRLAS